MKYSIKDKIWDGIILLVLFLICAIMLYPYLNQLAIAFNDGADSAMGGITVFPRAFTLENFRTVFANKSIGRAALISVSRVILLDIVSISVIFAAAYGLTRPGLPYKRQITLFLMIPAYISAGVIPIYMLYRYLHIINNYMVYILPHVFVFYYLVIIRSFLQDMPASIEESAKLDGANDFQILLHIMVPLSKPVIATVLLWISVGAWNDWTTTLMYVTDSKLYPLQYLMMKLVKESEMAQQMAMEAAMNGTTVTAQTTSESIKAATLIVTTIPIIMVYPFLQKYFIKGVMLGAVKG